MAKLRLYVSVLRKTDSYGHKSLDCKFQAEDPEANVFLHVLEAMQAVKESGNYLLVGVSGMPPGGCNWILPRRRGAGKALSKVECWLKVNRGYAIVRVKAS